MTQRRCQSCRDFYDKRLKACPACGAEKHPHNEGLRAALMNTNLLAQAQHAKLHG